MHDPLWSDEELVELGLRPYKADEAYEIAILQTNHPEYTQSFFSALQGLNLILDGRNALTDLQVEAITVITIGKP